MSYPNYIGEFVAQLDREDWVKSVQWNERRPVALRGSLNPWETERKRVLWEKERDVWPKIEQLKKEYYVREKQMERDISIFNSHLAELERVAKKKVGIGPIGSYGGMALAVLPGFGWFSAVFSAVSMLFEMIGGNKKKKRIKELMSIMEDAQKRLQVNQERLLAIQSEVKILMNVTEETQAQIEAKVQRDIEQQKAYQQLKDERLQTIMTARDQELARIRQATPKRVVYGNEL